MIFLIFQGREELFGLNKEEPKTEAKDLTSLMLKSSTPDLDKKREERIEYDAETAEKKAMAEWERAQKEREVGKDNIFF